MDIYVNNYYHNPDFDTELHNFDPYLNDSYYDYYYDENNSRGQQKLQLPDLNNYYDPDRVKTEINDMDYCENKSMGCSVCGDRVNGSRYGAPACLGCIVFFRRAITKEAKYKCLKGETCQITHESRCICRYCRLKKCLLVGMKPDAIQRRDIMGPRKRRAPRDDGSLSPTGSKDNSSDNENGDVRPEIIKLRKDGSSLNDLDGHLGRASSSRNSVTTPVVDRIMDNLIRLQEQQRSYHMQYFCMGEPFSRGVDMFEDIKKRISGGGSVRRARKGDVNTMIRLGILDAAQWANQFVPFRNLSLITKKSILTEFSFAFMLIDQGYLTAQRNDDDLWILQNNTYMNADYYRGLPEEDAQLKEVPTKAKLHPMFVQDALFSIGEPMKTNQIDLYECAVLKTILLLGHKNFFGDHREMVNKIQARILLEFMDYCKSKVGSALAPERMGMVLLQTASIRCTIKSVYNQTRVSDLFNLMTFDSLVRDVLLT
ncbi:hypothetical protein WR25_08263 [Diploscapter pachys]|uniref:Nuclear receptor domain-containing protein n=1 Tax=Diploscapter pachys TaxID=2018661 RepID=A0A2A2LHY1_9BILA|nr:hypothetical protein WR25_08263 [Diploscapter pachys]